MTYIGERSSPEMLTLNVHLQEQNRLARLVQTRYSSLEAEKVACCQWAASLENLVTPPEALRRLAMPSRRPHFLWTVAAWFVVVLVIVFGLCLPDLSPWIIFGSLAGAALLSRGFLYNRCLHWLLYPRAQRALLWMAWLGAPEALLPLTRQWRFRPKKAADQRWTQEVEFALTDLLDVLPSGDCGEQARDTVRAIIVCCTDAVPNADEDFSATRAYFLVAALRYLFGGATKGGVAPAFLGKLAELPTGAQALPHRALVRDVARMYRDTMSPNPTAAVMPSTAWGARPPLAQQIARLHSRK